MTLRLARIIGFVVLTHTAFGAARVTSSLYALSNKASTFTVGVVMALFALVPALLAAPVVTATKRPRAVSRRRTKAWATGRRGKD